MAVDIVKHFRPPTTDRQQVTIGRLTAVVVMLLAMAWSTQGDKFDSIFEAINKMPAQFLRHRSRWCFCGACFGAVAQRKRQLSR